VAEHEDELWDDFEKAERDPAPKEGDAGVKRMEPADFFGDHADAIQGVAYLAAAAILKLGGTLDLPKEEFKRHILLAFDIEHFRATGDLRVKAWETT